MRRTLPMATALVLVIAAGLVHGQWTRRWGRSDAVESAAARLERIPLTLGDWHAQSETLSRRQLEVAEIAGYVARRYENRAGKGAVTILLVCGRPGPISVHTPDICYAGAGFEPLQPPSRVTLPGDSSDPPAEFWSAVLSKPGASGPTHLRILWSWSATGAWEAPDNPRLAFAPRQVLDKLYVIRTLSAADEKLETDPSLDFLRVFLPELERILFLDS
jgi:hypothetical protein